MLCCDSYTDLQTSDLLRQLFTKSSEPLLSMVNSFIFTGDFEDPHSEFFVRKIFKRGERQQSGDYIFMFTSEPDKHVPSFLTEVAQIIFKAGSSLHLLRKQEMFSDSMN